MKINEFIKEVNKVAFARYEEKCDELTIYTSTDYVFDRAWFLLLKPHNPKDIIKMQDWNYLDDVSARELGCVLKLVRELENTPVNERFPKRKYCLPTRNNKFVGSANREYLYLGCDNVSLVRWDDERRTWSQDQLEAFSKMTNIPMPVIDYWKMEVKDDE